MAVTQVEMKDKSAEELYAINMGFRVFCGFSDILLVKINISSQNALYKSKIFFVTT